jgi:hypothetical protein
MTKGEVATMKYLVTIPALCLSLAILTLAKTSDVRAKDYPLDTTIAGMSISTRVDTETARDMLLVDQETASSEDHKDLQWEYQCHSLGDVPDIQFQREVTREYSIDTATALLLNCLTGIPEISVTQALFLSELAARRERDRSQADYLSSRSGSYVVLFVPGWGYLSAGEETGANLRKPRELISQFGYDTGLVPLRDFGSIEENAAILVESLRAYLGRDRKVLLVSASSGGAAVALALTQPDIAAHPMLAGWLNINGVLRGSPVIDRLRTWPGSLLLWVLAAFEEWTHDDLLSMSRERSLARFSKFRAPEQLVILNYIGVPFSAQVSRRGRTLFRILQSSGPNDGLTLVTESLAPGYTILAVGSDHFVNEDPEIDVKTEALLPVMLKLIESSSSILQEDFSGKTDHVR